jgi:alanyl-tRNA synthetase
MTGRLYYRDSYLREFDAYVVSCETQLTGNSGQTAPGWLVTLDQTAFYPTSGGQPHDTGWLSDASVLDVFERADGTIVHVTNREVALGPVQGSVDWPRRFDHMQQHTGSHLLCAAFETLFGIQTVSFHIGGTLSTLDFAVSSLSTEQLESAERFVNELVFADRPVRVQYGTAADLATLGVRNEADRAGILRAVEVEGVGIQACGGTHVCRTGQIGMILIRRMKKMRECWRVEFACGERARRIAREDFILVDEISQRLTCGPTKIHAAIARIVDERNAATRASERNLAEVAALKAKSLLSDKNGRQNGHPKANQNGSQNGNQNGNHAIDRPRIVVDIVADADIEYLRSVATHLIMEPGVVALLGSESNGLIVMAKSEGVSGDMNVLLREAVKACGGKGGGTTDFAQGSVAERSVLEGVLKLAAARHAARLSQCA